MLKMKSAVAGMMLGLCLAIAAAGKGYYVNSAASNASDAGAGSSAVPWKSLTPLDNHAFAAGDTVYFARGSSYTGGFRVSASGTAGGPIVFTAYGTGSAPSFTNPNYGTLNGNVMQISGSYVVVDGLYFHACATSPNSGDLNVLVVGAVYGVTSANYMTVQNSEFMDCPIGVYVNGQHCLITKNYLHDCSRFIPPDHDWGPICVFIGNAYTEVSWNRGANYSSSDGSMVDGGFIEVDSRYHGGTVHDLKIHHNKTTGNQGFLEIEGSSVTDSLNVWYNESHDYQQFIWFWGGSNSRIENNTVDRTLPGNVPGYGTNASGMSLVFQLGDPPQSGLLFRNNIFVVANQLQVWATQMTPNDPAVKHQYNLYYCTDNSTSGPCGATLGAGEKIGNPAFVNLAARDYHLTSSSPAKDAGTNLGYTVDLDGASVPAGSAPDMGAYEYGGVTAVSHSVKSAPPTSTLMTWRATTMQAYDLAGKRLGGIASQPRSFTGIMVLRRGASSVPRPSLAR